MPSMTSKEYKILQKKAKQIVLDRPKQWFVIDLTYLPSDLYKNTNYRYITKYHWSFY